MVGRALEGICVHQKTKAKTLAPGLKELLNKEIIDKRLFTWGEELRKLRNLGAHHFRGGRPQGRYKGDKKKSESQKDKEELKKGKEEEKKEMTSEWGSSSPRSKGTRRCVQSSLV